LKSGTSNFDFLILNFEFHPLGKCPQITQMDADQTRQTDLGSEISKSRAKRKDAKIPKVVLLCFVFAFLGTLRFVAGGWVEFAIRKSQSMFDLKLQTSNF